MFSLVSIIAILILADVSATINDNEKISAWCEMHFCPIINWQLAVNQAVLKQNSQKLMQKIIKILLAEDNIRDAMKQINCGKASEKIDFLQNLSKFLNKQLSMYFIISSALFGRKNDSTIYKYIYIVA